MKNLSLFLGVLILFSYLFSFSDQSHAENSLKIGSDEWPPFHSAGKSEKDVKGFTADLVRAVLKKMNVKIAAHEIYPWTRVCKMIFEGDLDAVFTTTRTDERMKYCYFPEEPLTDFSYLLFIRKEDEGKLTYNTFDDLKGHQIGIVRGFSYTEEFMNFIQKEKNYDEVKVGSLNFKKLMKKRIDYVATPKRVGYNHIRELGISDKCTALKKPLMVNHLYVMFSKKTVSKAFTDKFSEALKKFKTTREYKEIVDKHNW
jgi:polar amino acid transport system substrate-binding protein